MTWRWPQAVAVGEGEPAMRLMSGLGRTRESRRVKPAVVNRVRKLEQQLAEGGGR
ncbi:hypothetical protein ACFWJT_02510 [Streptomyces sp. NPDC127069]|uniref:hypothetical protein n=1 Tax=Streptomyces sp. NPDC127069 TaxID=3347128 RepID=UPI00364BE63C